MSWELFHLLPNPLEEEAARAGALPNRIYRGVCLTVFGVRLGHRLYFRVMDLGRKQGCMNGLQSTTQSTTRPQLYQHQIHSISINTTTTDLIPSTNVPRVRINAVALISRLQERPSGGKATSRVSRTGRLGETWSQTTPHRSISGPVNRNYGGSQDLLDISPSSSLLENTP